MHPLVRDLYKRFVVAGAHYPTGGWTAVCSASANPAMFLNITLHTPRCCAWLAQIRPRIKAGFQENADLTEYTDIARAVGRGRWCVRELHALHELHRYRALKKRYGQQ